jgi:hypothetical protein
LAYCDAYNLGLILARNLHGIDIDLRASQIAALALWLRCQRAYREMNLKQNRPEITKSNIVCAEPMPGESEMLKEFVANLQPKLLGHLVEIVFEKMKLAGEAGSLLKIEEELRDAIAGVKQRWVAETEYATDRKGQPMLFTVAEMDRLSKKMPQPQLFDFSEITDEQFWTEAESQVLAALRSYAAHASGGGKLQRQLFAEDAERGFAFIDLCQKRFDVVLMNPPFGVASLPSQPYIQEIYADTKGDVFKSFVECFQDRLVPAGLLGMISSRSGFFLGQSADWRERIVLRLFRPLVLADFGAGVLDAMVETAAYVLQSLNESETKQLTVRLLSDLRFLQNEGMSLFSIPQFQKQRGGIKRHQANSELAQLSRSGFVDEVSGKFRRFRLCEHKVRTAPTPHDELFPAMACFRLTADSHKADALAAALESMWNAKGGDRTYLTNPRDFMRIPGSPFAYWATGNVIDVFSTNPTLAADGRDAQVGASTKNDARFVRLWWEVSPAKSARTKFDTLSGKRWVPFAKGGAFSPFQADLEVVIDWQQDGSELKEYISQYRGSRGWGYNWTAALNGYTHYFRPGLVWSRRSQKGLSVRALPAGCIFGEKGPAILVPDDNHETMWWLLAVLNSRIFQSLLHMRIAFGSYEVGALEKMPVPLSDQTDKAELATLARSIVERKRSAEISNEIKHIFVYPYDAHHALANGRANATQRRNGYEEQLDTALQTLDALVDSAFGLSSTPLATCGAANLEAAGEDGVDDFASADDEDAKQLGEEDALKKSHTDLVSYYVGSLFGRWDVRFATGERPKPELPGPFAPLPLCSPGTLQGEDGLPLAVPPPGYPLHIDSDRIIPDDPDHTDDIIRRVREVLELIWKDQTDAIEKEASEVLGVKELRDYFRKPGKGGFWDDHVSRYTRSRRKAPIYWLVQSSKKNYGLWLYYHRLDKDMLFKARQNYVDPKIRLEQTRLDSLRSQKIALGADAKGARKIDKDIEKQEALLGELKDFADKLERAAKLNFGNPEKLDSDVVYDPDLNDGVVLNIAPLWEVVPWKEAKNYWEELLEGKYAWSSMGKLLRKKGLVT